MNKKDKPVVRLLRKKKRRSELTISGNERGDIVIILQILKEKLGPAEWCIG